MRRLKNDWPVVGVEPLLDPGVELDLVDLDDDRGVFGERAIQAVVTEAIEAKLLATKTATLRVIVLAVVSGTVQSVAR